MPMNHSYYGNQNITIIFIQVYHYKPYPFHETNLDTITLHMLIFDYHNTNIHNHASYFISIFPYKILHLYNKMFPTHYASY